MIEVKNLKYSYKNNGVYEVDDISFKIEEGETFGFLGPNGAGKSTTQNILTGLLPMQGGEASICGVDIRKLNSKFFNLIGVSFEFPNAYQRLTALENMKYYASLFDVKTEDPIKLLKLVGLDHDANKKVSDYSKGMLQRLVLARSMLNNPKVWFLDEPISGLDPNTAKNIKNVIKEEKKRGKTIFLTTHDMHIADELCDRVAFMDKGKLVVVDSPRSLKMKYGDKSLNVEYKDGGKVKLEKISVKEKKDRERLNQLLDKGVETVHSGEATLEDIFIELTGRGLN